jgi:DNA-binding MarR family transcriptional regulator
MPPVRKPAEAADALVGVAPLVARWMERLLAEHRPPLTLGQYLALRAIARESLGTTELARRTGVSGPAVSQLVAGLIELGLARRSPGAADDRRRHTFMLSAAGERAATSSARLMGERLGVLIDDLPKPEVDALARALPRVEATLSGAPPPRKKHHGPKHHGPKHRRPKPHH